MRALSVEAGKQRALREATAYLQLQLQVSVCIVQGEGRALRGASPSCCASSLLGVERGRVWDQRCSGFRLRIQV